VQLGLEPVSLARGIRAVLRCARSIGRGARTIRFGAGTHLFDLLGQRGVIGGQQVLDLRRA